ncbi:hypothetical protein GOODEAATRI_008303 [Goodea atripinnis]|uniref:Serine/threonine-protein phosphatase 4 regulatory subunit 1 n=1 Tax=Goodea atripinnis TaxID=208336 RepID=A0ABV0MQC2_9TELE
MEQVPNIAMFLHESRPNFPAAFSRYLVPIVIMCKVVTMLSKDTVEHLLLPRFCDLCSDARLFQVRKVCAGNFGEFCTIVGQEATEKLLVRQAAFQSLGRFISTFANPSSTGLHFREDGALPEVPRCTSDSCHKERTITHTLPNQDGRATPSPEHVSTPDCEDVNHFDDSHFSVPAKTHNSLTVTEPCLVQEQEDEQTQTEPQEEEEEEEEESSPNSPFLESELIESVEEEEKDDCPHSPVSEDKPKIQNIIPQQLLDQYLSMTDPARAQTVDTEIAKHCAFSLPGVALTLGRQNWHCLKDTYETLASDVQVGSSGLMLSLTQWKVRRTLAFSIHELAVILGDQLTAADLVPIFNGFLKDLDEVRIGVLKHLYDFLKVVEILQKLYACGADDLGQNFINELTVRFCHCPKWVGRQAFAFICQAIVEEDCMPMDQFSQHLLPSLLSLSSDPVANVRVLVAKALRQSVMEKGNLHMNSLMDVSNEAFQTASLLMLKYKLYFPLMEICVQLTLRSLAVPTLTSWKRPSWLCSPTRTGMSDSSPAWTQTKA